MTGRPRPRDRIVRHWEAAQTIHRLFQHLDDGHFAEMATLFLPLGVWVRQGADLVGPEAVLAAMAHRPADLVTCHCVTNLIVDDGDEDDVAARYYVTTFAYQGATQGPAPLSVPQFVFLCEDRLRETEAGWRFARRVPRPIFKRTER